MKQNNKKIIVQQRDLPVPVEVIGEQGERKYYQMRPRRNGKNGAFLNADEQKVKHSQ